MSLPPRGCWVHPSDWRWWQATDEERPSITIQDVQPDPPYPLGFVWDPDDPRLHRDRMTNVRRPS